MKKANIFDQIPDVEFLTKNDMFFYTVDDKCLFWIVGYVENAYSKKMAKMLQEKTHRFEENGAVGEILTCEVFESRRYKSMRVFYCYQEAIPPNCYQLNKGWTMNDWVRN